MHVQSIMFLRGQLFDFISHLSLWNETEPIELVFIFHLLILNTRERAFINFLYLLQLY